MFSYSQFQSNLPKENINTQTYPFPEYWTRRKLLDLIKIDNNLLAMREEKKNYFSSLENPKQAAIEAKKVLNKSDRISIFELNKQKVNFVKYINCLDVKLILPLANKRLLTFSINENGLLIQAHDIYNPEKLMRWNVPININELNTKMLHICNNESTLLLINKTNIYHINLGKSNSVNAISHDIQISEFLSIIGNKESTLLLSGKDRNGQFITLAAELSFKNEVAVVYQVITFNELIKSCYNIDQEKWLIINENNEFNILTLNSSAQYVLKEIYKPVNYENIFIYPNSYILITEKNDRLIKATLIDLDGNNLESFTCNNSLLCVPNDEELHELSYDVRNNIFVRKYQTCTMHNFFYQQANIIKNNLFEISKDVPKEIPELISSYLRY